MNALETIWKQVMASDEMGPFLLVSILVLSGLLGDWIGKRLRLPHVTGYILGGIIVGPAGLSLIGTHEHLHSLQPLSTFAMSLIAVNAGGHLSYRRIHNSIRRIISISIFQVTLTAAFVALACRLFGLSWPTTLLLSAIAVSSAPSSILALIRELRAKGSFVKTMISTVAIDNILSILLFVMVHTFVTAYYQSGETFGQIGDAFILPAFHLIGSLALGLGIGWTCKRVISHHKFHEFTAILLAIMVCDGVAIRVGLNPLLSSLFFGVFLGNSTGIAEKQLRTLQPLEPILYVCFFTLAGVSLHLDAIPKVGPILIVYFTARLAGKSLGAALGGIIARSKMRMWKSMSYSLFPQADIAIGLTVLLASDNIIPEEVTYFISAIVLGGITLNELLGPLCTKAALIKTGEAGKDRQRLVEFLSEEFVMMDLKALDKWDAIRQMTDFLMRTHRVEHLSFQELYESVVEREKTMSTALGSSVALPHGHIEEGPSIQGVLAICPDGVDFDAPDGKPAKLLMLIVTPADHQTMHLKVLASLSAMVRDERIRTRLISAISPEDAIEIIESKEARDYNYFLD